jgi:DNA-binding transcriptional ArsR family regulator
MDSDAHASPAPAPAGQGRNLRGEALGQALASGHRLELLDLLAQAERSVEELARETGLTVAYASQHPQVLRRVHLVERRQEGTYVYYPLADPGVFRLWQALREAGESQLADVERIVRDYREQAGDIRPAGMVELSERLRGGRVVVFDVRPRREYEAGRMSSWRRAYGTRPGSMRPPPTCRWYARKPRAGATPAASKRCMATSSRSRPAWRRPTS